VIQTVDDLLQRFENVNRLMKEMLGVILVLKKKGLVFDDEIAQALTDAHKAATQKDSVRPQETGSNEDNSGNGGHNVLREEGTGSDRGGKSNPSE